MRTRRRGHGCGSGLGRGLALELAARGAQLALSDVDGAALHETVRRCEPAGGKIRAFELDVSDRRALLAHAEEVESVFGAVNLLINNAGVAVIGSVEDTSFDDLDWLLGINLMGVINGSKAFLPLPHPVRRRAPGEHLERLRAGRPGVPERLLHGQVRGARLHRVAATEMLISGQPVSVHCVHPGGVKTNIARRARYAGDPNPLGPDPAERFDRLARTSPEVAARKILAGVDRNSPRILVGTDAYLIAAIPRLLGAGYVDLWRGPAAGSWRR